MKIEVFRQACARRTEILPIQVQSVPFTTTIEKIVENKFSQLNDLCILSNCNAKLSVVMEFDSE